MRDAWRDEDEIASGVLDAVSATVTELVSHMAREDVKHHLEIDVNMCVCDAAGWDGGDVHRKLLCGDVFGGETDLVVDVIPIPNVAGGADGPNSVVRLHVGSEVRHVRDDR